jgi:hypothetical protein
LEPGISAKEAFGVEIPAAEPPLYLYHWLNVIGSLVFSPNFSIASPAAINPSFDPCEFDGFVPPGPTETCSSKCVFNEVMFIPLKFFIGKC